MASTNVEHGSFGETVQAREEHSDRMLGIRGVVERGSAGADFGVVMPRTPAQIAIDTMDAGASSQDPTLLRQGLDSLKTLGIAHEIGQGSSEPMQPVTYPEDM
jgi:hypothetical protein